MADGAYAVRKLLAGMMGNDIVGFSRIRKDAALFVLPTPKFAQFGDVVPAFMEILASTLQSEPATERT
jgi:hypothetical protein